MKAFLLYLWAGGTVLYALNAQVANHRR